jgi:hypothetical protein
MLAPIAQITCSGMTMSPFACGKPNGANDHPVEITNHSMKINHRPRLSRNAPSSRGVLRPLISPALVPASSTNTGAQKCVTQRVKNSSVETLGSAIGFCTLPVTKASRA